MNTPTVEDLLDSLTNGLNDDLREAGYDVEVWVNVSVGTEKSPGRSYQLRNRFTGQVLSPIVYSAKEIMVIISTLRIFIKIPRNDE